MDIKKYLQRIRADEGPLTPAAETLRLLQRRHLLNVPFENLDIHWKRPIELDTGKFYRKIVGENRGGFCYELNGLFNVLLNELGFESRMVSARVSAADGSFSPEYDHMAVLVKADGEEYLADVGFGDFIAEPLKFVLDIEQEDKTGSYSIRKFPYEGDEYFLIEKKDGEGWYGEYIFTATAREISEYSGMCDFHQTSTKSHFMKNKVCSMMTEAGRKTLTGDKFIVTENGGRTETPVTSEEQFNEILKSEFNIVPLN